MKIILGLFLLLMTSVSCVSISDIHSFQKSSQNTLEEGKSEFIELNNGTFIEGEIADDNIKKFFKMVGGKGSITINDKKYSDEKIKSFQTKSNYYAKVDGVNFGERIIKGKINLYTLIHLNNFITKGTPFNLNYIQKGEKTKLKNFTIRTFEKMVNDNSFAMEELNKYKKLNSKQKISEGDLYLNNAITIYNGVK
jgi:hypothetical protein